MKSTLTTGVVSVGRLCLLLCMVAAFVSCGDVNCIKGEGRTETRILELQPFTKVASNGSFKVYITQGATQKVEVKGEPNILSQLRTEVSNATWEIEHSQCVRRSKTVEVYITMPEVQALHLNGSGSITSQSLLTTNELPVSVNGSGKIDLDVTASKVITQLNGSGAVVLRGTAPVHTVSIGGSGKAAAFSLNSDNVTVNISGSGRAEVTANNLLDVVISGSGEVHYRGNPDLVSQQVSGSGKVVKK